MTATNVSYYAAAFDATGKRVATKICDFNPLKNPKQRAALLDEVKACAASAAVVDIITSDDFIAYLDGKVRDSKTGRPVDYVPPEPTAEEKAAAEKASLAAEYEANKTEMLTALQAATLAGNSDAVSSIQRDYKAMTAAYKEAVEGVTVK